jgi:hypothetical protein
MTQIANPDRWHDQALQRRPQRNCLQESPKGQFGIDLAARGPADDTAGIRSSTVHKYV